VEIPLGVATIPLAIHARNAWAAPCASSALLTSSSRRNTSVAWPSMCWSICSRINAAACSVERTKPPRRAKMRTGGSMAKSVMPKQTSGWSDSSEWDGSWNGEPHPPGPLGGRWCALVNHAVCQKREPRPDSQGRVSGTLSEGSAWEMPGPSRGSWCVLAPPALGESLHSRLARRLVAVRWRAVLMLPEGERP
jgi:hypothetical protein